MSELYTKTVEKTPTRRVVTGCVPKAELLYGPSRNWGSVVINRNSKSVEQIARETNTDVYAFKTYTETKRLLLDHGEVRHVLYEKNPTSGMIYINGKLLSIIDIRESHDQAYTRFMQRILCNYNTSTLISTTAGIFPFQEGDRNIYTKIPRE